MNTIENLSEEGGTFYKLDEADLNKIDGYHTLVDALYQGQSDGLIIKNVLSPTEVEETIKVFNEIDKQKAVDLKAEEGFILPRAFAQTQRENENDTELLMSYFEDARWFATYLQAQLSFNIEQRIFDTLSHLQKNIPVETPSASTNGIKAVYNCCTFRYLKPGKGGMHIHCGGMFKDIYPTFYKPLVNRINFKDQLGYFIMLQRCSTGGKLRVYDARWENCDEYHDDRGFVFKNGIVQSVERTAYRDIDLMPGDMLLFNEAGVWHGVTNPEDGSARVTIGGFAGYSTDRQKLYVWA